jgi:hypothetical protein
MHIQDYFDGSGFLRDLTSSRRPSYASMMLDLHGLAVGVSICDDCGAVVPEEPPEGRRIVDRCLGCGRPFPTRCVGWPAADGEHHACADRTLLPAVPADGRWYADAQCAGCLREERHANTLDWLAARVGEDVCEAAVSPANHGHQFKAVRALIDTLRLDGRGRPVLRAVGISGGVGSGKTTVVAAHVYNLIVGSGTRVTWLPEGKLLQALKGQYQDGDAGLEAQATLARARMAPVLVVDEFGSWGWSGWTEHARRLLSELLVGRFDDTSVVTLLIGNEVIEWPDSRVESRFHRCGRLVRCEGPDLRVGRRR